MNRKITGKEETEKSESKWSYQNEGTTQWATKIHEAERRVAGD